jgi:selenocysteine lyase/cysteine desulfurase
MGGPKGTGALIIRADRIDALVPPEVGAYSNDAYAFPYTFSFNKTAQRFECGTRAAADIAGLLAAVQFLGAVGMEKVQARNRELALLTRRGLEGIKGVHVLTPAAEDCSHAMVTFVADAMPFDQLFGKLLSKGLRLRPVSELGLNALRVSTHLANSEEDVAKLLAAMSELC